MELKDLEKIKKNIEKEKIEIVISLWAITIDEIKRRLDYKNEI